MKLTKRIPSPTKIDCKPSKQKKQYERTEDSFLAQRI